MNINNLQILLQEAIKNTNKTVDYLLLAKAVQALNIGQVRTVETFSNLPSAAENTGLLVFVEADERLYSSTGTIWVSLEIYVEGYVWAWGASGRLGDGAFTNRSSPVSVVGGFTNWCQVSAGDSHSLGVRCNGTAWTWGSGACGRLGDGTITDRLSPVLVAGGFTDWYQVSAGFNHSLGIRCNGTAWAWGNNVNGRLGDDTTVNKSSPVSVVGGFTDWCQVSAGNAHSLGVRCNGTLWAWGCNASGQLGDNTIVSKSSPVSVVGGFTDWCQVSASLFHSLGVRCNGTLWAWGSNSYGQLGDNTTIGKSSPVSVVGGFTDWCQVSSGSSHSLGVRQNGTAWAWGCNSCGALGEGTTTNRSSPVSVVGGFTDWCQVSGCTRNSLGVRINGTAWAWGQNSYGRLGDSTTIDRSSPVSVVGGFTDWCQVSAGGFHSIGIRISN